MTECKEGVWPHIAGLYSRSTSECVMVERLRICDSDVQEPVDHCSLPTLTIDRPFKTIRGTILGLPGADAGSS
jgi:hypothetical protein